MVERKRCVGRNVRAKRALTAGDGPDKKNALAYARTSTLKPPKIMRLPSNGI